MTEPTFEHEDLKEFLEGLQKLLGRFYVSLELANGIGLFGYWGEHYIMEESIDEVVLESVIRSLR